MERDNRPPEELTRPGPNTYSRSMPETGDIPAGGSGDRPPTSTERAKAERMRMMEEAARLSPEELTSRVDQLMAQFTANGVPVDINSRQTFRTMIENGINPMAGGDGTPAPPTRDQVNAAVNEYATEHGLDPLTDRSLILDRLSEANALKAVKKAGNIGRGRRGQTEADLEASFPTVDLALVTDPELQDVGNIINSVKNNFVRDEKLIDQLRVKIDEIIASNPALSSQANVLNQGLNDVLAYVKKYQEDTEEEVEGTFQLSLTPEDFRRLKKDPLTWLRSHINRIYEHSTEGSELDSVQVRAAQQQQEVGSRYLIGIHAPPEIIKQFDEEFKIKVDMIYARSVVQQRNLEGIANYAKKLQSHGILTSLALEDGLVNRMHNRIQDVYDDMRVRLPEHHITPDVHSSIQSRVIDEYAEAIMADDEVVGKILGKDFIDKTLVYSVAKQQELIREAITRSVRSGYDHFVASQREAVVVSRGDALPTDKNLKGILADPSGLFMMFNYEQLLVKKFGLLNFEQQEFFDAVKRRYAESILGIKAESGELSLESWLAERVKNEPDIQYSGGHGHGERTLLSKDKLMEQELIRYGEVLVKDMMLVPDFYSSGWKIDEYLGQIDQILIYQHVRKGLTAGELRESFDGLHKTEQSKQIKSRIEHMSQTERDMILESAKDFALFMRLRRGGADKSGEVWGKIAQFRPEDIAKIVREKGSSAEIAQFNALFEELGISSVEGEHHGFEKLTHIDKFKDEYGLAMHMVREKGFAGDIPEQVDFSQLDSNPEYEKYRKIFSRVMKYGEADSPEARVGIEKFAKFYGKLQKLAGDEEFTNKLMKDSRFQDIYSRTFSVDDVLLDRLERVDEGAGLVQLSRRLSVETGGDAYLRTFNDAVAANEAHGEFLKFLTAESQKEKEESALKAAKSAQRYGSPMVGAKVFRYTYGSYMLMGAVTTGKRGTLYETLDIKKLPFNKPINELQRIFGYQAPSFNNDEMLHFLEHHKNDLVGNGHDAHDKKGAEVVWQEMRRLAKVTSKDRVTFMLYRALLFAMIYIALEGAYDIKEGLNSPELSGGGGGHH